jgi:hypothetical protein
MKIPVTIIIFNRPENTKRLFESLNIYKPETLFVISDGPRKNFEDDQEKVIQSRKIFEKIDWKCEVYFNNSESNLGCRERIITGLNWVFGQVEKTIILEDDCIPSEEFFIFMELMLNKYQTNKDISSVCGTNFLPDWSETKDSYLYSKYCHVWGWGTWKDCWEKIDFNLDKLHKIKKTKFLKSYLGSFRAYLYWHWILDRVKGYKINSWAYIWIYTGFIKKHLHVIPKINLISNVGIGMDSTHTKSYPVYYIPSNKINNKFNSSLPAPLNVVANHKFDKDVENRIYSKSIQNRIFWILKKIFKY